MDLGGTLRRLHKILNAGLLLILLILKCHPTKIEALKESAASLPQQFGLPPFELFHSTCEQCFILLSKERAILNNLVIEYICSPALGSGQTSLAPALQLGEAEEKSWLASG